MKPYRKERVASVIREIVCDALAHRLNDPRIAPLTTVTRVELSADLLVADVYVVVQGDRPVEVRTMAALRRATGFIRRLIAHEVRIRQCPALRFHADKGALTARLTYRLLEENLRAHPEWMEESAAGGDILTDKLPDDRPGPSACPREAEDERA